jgi:hypothetical protein
MQLHGKQAGSAAGVVADFTVCRAAACLIDGYTPKSLLLR